MNEPAGHQSQTITSQDLPLQRAYRWEFERANEIFLSQPTGSGVVRTWTWMQAMDEARRVAAWLTALHLEPQSRIAIMSKNTAWWFMADLAIWMAGHVSVPVYPNLQAKSARQILEHSQSRVVFIGKLDDAPAITSGIPVGVRTVAMPMSTARSDNAWDAIVAASTPLPGQRHVEPGDIATIIYTSGTTGASKGAVHAFAAFGHSSRALHSLFGCTPNDRFFSYLPLAHVAERCLIEGYGIHVGAPVAFAESLDTFVSDLQRTRPTVFFSVPRLWVKFQQGVFRKMPEEKLRRLLRIPLLAGVVKRRILKGLGLDAVRFAGTGAAPLTPEVVSWYRNLGLELLEGYGMTEQFAFATVSVPGRSRVGYVGEPLNICKLRLSDTGEVQSRGPAHMLGYFKDDEKTREAFTQDGWLRTGDLGEFDSEGRLRIVGRLKEQFKTAKGKYVAPAPIECLLESCLHIEACIVTGSSYPQPFAIAILSQDVLKGLDCEENRKQIVSDIDAHLDFVNRRVDPHEQLAFVAIVSDNWTPESGLTTPTLKLKRAALERRYEGSFARWASSGRRVILQLTGRT